MEASYYLKRCTKIYVIAIIIAIVLYFAFQIEPMITMGIVGVWPLIGSLITIDDELPGGFYNPDGDEPFPRELFMWAAILAVVSLCTGALLNLVLVVQ